MIRQLHLKDVGPARELKFVFSSRLNVLTGDNGLGKTFVLDVLWWVVTTTWVGKQAFPYRAPTPDELREAEPLGYSAPVFPRILARHARPSGGESLQVVTDALWSTKWQQWYQPEPPQRRQMSKGDLDSDSQIETPHSTDSIVLYARSDGSYAVWDSYYAKGGLESFADAAIVLEDQEVWDGKEIEDARGKRTVIRGMIEDWVTWQQKAKSQEFEALRRVLHALSPPDETLVPGEPTRVELDDRRDIPTVSMAYGDIPITLASAGMRRVLSLAYLVVWTWTEHKKAAETTSRPLSQDIVVIVDEPELHLHPAWQRTVLPALLRAISTIAPNAAVQVFATTHSPLVLASLEPHFDVVTDALFTFDVMPRARRVTVEKVAWRPRGDVSNWLTSDVFDLAYARSREAELALESAVKVLDKPDLSDAEAREIHRELYKALGDTDPFWARWLSYAKAKGIEP